MLFQSLIGFKINWNTRRTTSKGTPKEFQSLIGFKINWNSEYSAFGTAREGFQSLIGFKINWNLIKGGYLKIVDKVSIPNRV